MADRTLAERYAAAVVRRRVPVIIAMLACTLALGRGLWHAEIDPSLQRLYPRDAQQRATDEAFARTFGNIDNVVAIILETDDVLAPAMLAWSHDLTTWLGEQQWADHALGITTYPFAYRPDGATDIEGTAPASLARALADVATGRIRAGPVGPDRSALQAALDATPLVNERLIASDRSTALTAVLLREGVHKYGDVDTVLDAIEQRLDEVPAPTGAKTTITGTPHVRVGLIKRLRADQGLLIAAAMLIVFAMMAFTFRWWAAIVFPCWTVGMAAIMTTGAMGWVGAPFDMVSANVPVVILVIGIADSVHYLLRYGEELAAGHSGHEASRRALAAIAAACLATSATTAAAFASLALSDNQVISLFGLACAAGIMIAFVATTTFLPARLATVKPPKRPLAEIANRRLDALVVPVTRWSVRNHRLVLAGTAIVFAATIAAGTQLRRDTTIQEHLPEGDEIRDSFALLEAKFGGIRPIEVGVRGELADPARLDAIDRVQNWARAQPGVLQSTSHTDLLRQAWFVATGDDAARTASFATTDSIASLHALVEAGGPRRIVSFSSADLSHLRIQVRLSDDVTARETMAFAAQLLERARAELPDVEIAMTGEGLTSAVAMVSVAEDLTNSVFLAIAVIVALMALLFRSFGLALLVTPPCLLPLAVTMALMFVIDIPLTPGNITVFAACAGLAVDGAIHMVARYREERHAGKEGHDAVLCAAQATARANVYTYIGLTACVSVFLLSTFPPTQRFGIIMGITALGCLASTLIVLPAVLALRR